VSRVIAGVAGGRRLVMPSGAGTRPTTDRAREGLFSTIASLLGGLSGRSFLDLYAGSGAVGLEAASRGAGPVVLVERDQRALRALRMNVTRLALTGVTVRAEAVARFLAEAPEEAFDVVFADPPYAEPVEPDQARLVAGGGLVPDALVCVERASRGEPPAWPDGLEPLRSRRYGDSTLWYGRAL
jgi:16S rRNA (guanine966-N2)-methyltransferase